MRKLKTLGSALVVALVLVTCADYVGYAATGSSFILGHSNSANKVTGLARTTAGAALDLHTSTSASAPFTTNAKGKVANLNADRLDGLDSTKFSLAQHPLRVISAADLPGRSVTVTNGGTIAQQIAFTVPAECGTNTRHRYLAQSTAWISSDGIIRTSIALDTASIQFGDGFTLASGNSGYASTAASRPLVLAPGSHTVYLYTDLTSGTYGSLGDPSLTLTDLGYTCAGGATTASRSAQGSGSLTGLR